MYLSQKMSIIKSFFTKWDTQTGKCLISARALRCANLAISCRSYTLTWLNFNEQLFIVLFSSVTLSMLISYHSDILWLHSSVPWPQWQPFVGSNFTQKLVYATLKCLAFSKHPHCWPPARPNDSVHWAQIHNYLICSECALIQVSISLCLQISFCLTISL